MSNDFFWGLVSGVFCYFLVDTYCALSRIRRSYDTAIAALKEALDDERSALYDD